MTPYAGQGSASLRSERGERAHGDQFGEEADRAQREGLLNRRGEAAERFAERRRLEDEAPRLRDVVPDLTACRVEIEESRAGTVTGADVKHTRRLVVERAPALLIIPCSDASCREGGYDLSSALLRGLREHRTEIRGEDTCRGRAGNSDCGRVLRFTAFAEYGGTP